jgi:hypothetical protein
VADVIEHRRVQDGTAVSAEKGGSRDVKALDRTDGGIREVRSSDIEPYTGLRYLSKLFRFMGIIMLLLLVAEVVTGIYTQGSASVPTLLGEASRLIVLAGVLWGTGDLALLLIDVGHDVRAARILMARIAHKANVAPLVATVDSRGNELGRENGSVVRSDVVPMADRPLADRPVPRSDSGDDSHGPPIP